MPLWPNNPKHMRLRITRFSFTVESSGSLADTNCGWVMKLSWSTGRNSPRYRLPGFVNGHAPNGHGLVLAAAGQPNPKIIVAVKTPLLEGKHAGEGFEQRQLQLNMGDVCGTHRWKNLGLMIRAKVCNIRVVGRLLRA